MWRVLLKPVLHRAALDVKAGNYYFEDATGTWVDPHVLEVDPPGVLRSLREVRVL